MPTEHTREVLVWLPFGFFMHVTVSHIVLRALDDANLPACKVASTFGYTRKQKEHNYLGLDDYAYRYKLMLQ